MTIRAALTLLSVSAITTSALLMGCGNGDDTASPAPKPAADASLDGTVVHEGGAEDGGAEDAETDGGATDAGVGEGGTDGGPTEAGAGEAGTDAGATDAGDGG
jgi:hypothetical protein